MERPILFSTPMVRAILNGRKSQTRRVCKPQPIYDYESGYVFIGHLMFDIHDKWDIPMYLKDTCKYEIGDILWVRETWRPKGHRFPIGFPYEYKATAKEDGNPFDEPWKPSIFMPKEACRIKLTIKDIRIERLQEITEYDAIAEGIESENGVYKDYLSGEYYRKPIQSYLTLWESINGRGSWLKNPWVSMIEFEELKPE